MKWVLYTSIGFSLGFVCDRLVVKEQIADLQTKYLDSRISIVGHLVVVDKRIDQLASQVNEKDLRPMRDLLKGLYASSLERHFSERQIGIDKKLLPELEYFSAIEYDKFLNESNARFGNDQIIK